MAVAFALETENGTQNAVAKLNRKNCDLVVLNDPSAIEAQQTQIRILDAAGKILADVSDSKLVAAQAIIQCLEKHVID